MSRIERGTHPLAMPVTLSDDGTVGFDGARVAGAGDWQEAVVEVPNTVEWTCEDDDGDEELEVSLPVTQFAEMMVKVRKYDALIRAGVIDG